MKTKISLVFFFFYYMLPAQQTRPSVRWYELNTPHFRIIYPEKIKTQAVKIAGYLESAYRPTGEGLSTQPKRTPVILNNRNVIPNAYARLAPRKMEWNLTPDPDLYFGTGSWKKLLALHEFRHITQFDAAHDGFIFWSSIIGGQAGHMINLFWAYPLWFFEGDAVYNETLLSYSGRGRSPYFYLPVITAVNEYSEKDLDYYKFYFRSYKTYYPSHYHLGYFLTSYLHQNYSGKYARIYRNTAWWGFLPGAMHWTLQLQTGLNYRRLTRFTFHDLKKYYLRYQSVGPKPVKRVIPEQPQTYTNDMFPQILDDNTLVFLRTGFNDAPALWQYDFQHKPRKVKPLAAYRFHTSAHYAVWTEYKTHPRWQNEVYKRIGIYDFRTGKTHYLQAKGNFQNPVLSPDTKRIAVVDYDAFQEPYLRLFDRQTGRLIKSFHFGVFESIRQPAWHPSGNKIVFTAITSGKGSGLYEIDLASANVKTLLPPAHNRYIQYPQYLDDKILFEKGSTDIQIALFDPETKKTSLLTGEMYAASMPFYDSEKQRVYYSSYGPGGYRIRYTPLNRHGSIKKRQFRIPAYFNPRDQQPLKFTDTVMNNYTVKPFNHFKSYLNPHSWFWLAGANEQLKPTLYAQLFMTDILDESFFSAGGYTISNEYAYFAQWEWKRYFPVIGVRFEHVYRETVRSHFNDWDIYVRIPLNFSSGIWHRHFSFKTGLTLRRTLGLSTRRFAKNELYYSVFLRRSYRDPDSRIGMNFSLSTQNEIKRNAYFWNAAFGFHLPGFFKHDIFAGKLGTGANRHLYHDFMPLRGNYIVPANRLVYLQTTWHTPLFYPDAGFKRLFNLKRVRLKLFYDRFWADKDRIGAYSYGFQLIGDWNLLGFLPTVPVGIQVARVQGFSKPVISLVFMDIPLY